MAFLQPGILPAEHELKTLGHKLDFTNAAPAELDINAAPALLFEAPVDLFLNLFDLLQSSRVQIFAENERPHDAQELTTELLAASHRPRLQKHLALPGLAPGFVINLKMCQRIDEGATAAIGTQP